MWVITFAGGVITDSTSTRRLALPTLQRLERTCALYRDRQQEIATILVTGGKNKSVEGRSNVADAMADYLIAHGVPSKMVRVENRSSSTIENLQESLGGIPEGAELLLVSDQAHLRRIRLTVTAWEKKNKKRFQAQDAAVAARPGPYARLSEPLFWLLTWLDPLGERGLWSLGLRVRKYLRHLGLNA